MNNNIKYYCPHCGSHDTHIEYYDNDGLICKCIKCKNKFNHNESTDYEWDKIHFDWIESIGGKEEIISYIESYITHGVYKDVIEHIFFNYSCRLLFNYSGHDIIRNRDVRKSLFREVKINQILE